MTAFQSDVIFQQVAVLLEKYCPQPVAVQEDTELINDLRCDSLRVMEMLYHVEDTFDITYPINDLAGLRTAQGFAIRIQRIIENG